MENEFLNKIKRIKDTENLITLQKTKKITKDDLPEWLHLKEAYDETEDSIQRTIVSLFNSIMYQRRLYFVLTRDATKRLVREDKNHKIKTAFRNNYWQTIIAKCTNELKMLELVAIENNVAVYKCIDETIRNYIKIDGKPVEIDSIFDKQLFNGLVTTFQTVYRNMEKNDVVAVKFTDESLFAIIIPGQ